MVELDADDRSHGEESEDETPADYSTHFHIPEWSPNDISVAFHRVGPDPRRYPSSSDQQKENNNASDVGPLASRLERISLQRSNSHLEAIHKVHIAERENGLKSISNPNLLPIDLTYLER